MLVLTYFQVLLVFIAPPIVLFGALTWRQLWQRVGTGRLALSPALAIGVLIIVALIYTTPWDNYLVATSVWWYDDALVTGLTIGYVPIEEYTFFVVQTIMTGLLTVWLRSRLAPRPVQASNGLRIGMTAGLGLVWLVSTVFLLSGYAPATYLTLILSWALLPIMLQTAFGADILRANWRLLSFAIGLPTLYLWVVDYIAIQGGTWSIDPAQTLGWNVGVLPMEEMTFFLVTNVLVAFGVTLILAPESEARFLQHIQRVRGLLNGKTKHVTPTD